MTLCYTVLHLIKSYDKVMKKATSDIVLSIDRLAAAVRINAHSLAIIENNINDHSYVIDNQSKTIKINPNPLISIDISEALE